jgi:hypothetical protein
MLGYPTSTPEREVSKSSSANVPVNATLITGRVPMVRSVPGEYGGAVNVVEEYRRSMRSKFAIAETDLTTFLRNGIEH